MHFPAAVRAFAVNQLGVRPERFAGRAVPALIFTLIDITLLVEALEYLLHLQLMILVGGPDELVIGGVHQIPDLLDNRNLLVNISLRLHAGRPGLFFNLLAMLVGARHKEDVITALSLIAGNGISHYDFIGVADVRLSRGIGNSGGNIVFFFFFHFPFTLFE